MVKKQILFLGLLLFGVSIAANAQVKVTGKVTEAGNGQPIPLAHVAVKGTNVAVSSNAKGEYVIEIPEGSTTLTFASMGFAEKEEIINKRTVINVSMKESMEMLEDVVVVAYGAKSIASVSGNVASVRSKDISKMPTASFDQALQGKAAGVMVSTSSGRPGAKAVIRIRGTASINSGNDPLYIIDGVTSSSNEFTNLSNHDIESVNILKDASATALYGSRAANGVVLITTKKGRKSDRAEVLYNGHIAWDNRVKENFNLMNSEQKLGYEQKLGLKTAEQVQDFLGRGANTNWIDELMGETGFTQAHEFSVRGGGEKVRYYASANYANMGAILVNSEMKRLGFFTNLEADATDALKVGTSINLTQIDSNLPITTDLSSYYSNSAFNPSLRALLENPYVGVYREDGSYTDQADGLLLSNPIEHQLLNPTTQSHFRVMASAWAELKVWEDKIKAKTIVGVEDMNSTDDSYTSPKSAWGQGSKGEMSRSFSRGTRVTNSNTVTYNDTYSDLHNLTLLLGQETVMYKTDGFGVSAVGFANNIVNVIGAAAKYTGKPSGNRTKNTLASVFGSANYNYAEKYYVDLSYRFDGCSRFGEDNRWGGFGSVGAMWNIKRENFLSEIKPISSLKLRASYGTMGNYNIGNYAHLSAFSVSSVYNEQSAGFLGNPENKDLTWEVVKMYDFGLNFALLDNRIRGDISYYNKTTTDMLFQVPLSPTTGFLTGTKNVGEMVNKGFELKLDFTVLDMNGFSWDIGGTLGYNKNEIKELYDGLNEIVYAESSTILRIGESFGTRYINRFAGVNPANGTTLWYDANGKKTETFRSSDMVALPGKSWIPDFTGGFNTAVSYKGFELQADFSFMNNFWVINNNRLFIESNGTQASYNQSVKMLNHWEKPGDISANPDPNLKQSKFDDRLLEDASFLRLKNLSLSYTFPEKLITKSKVLRSARLYAQGFNLFTWTKYQGYDPEIYGSTDLGRYPQVRKFVFGVQLGF